MNYDIKKQIENINDAIEWIRKNRPNEYESKFLQLVEERRKLKSIADASETNPGIAAYGVSQVGKSYLMNCMLQKEGKPFMLEANGKRYNFIEEMNPKTKNVEATGVVTRFTSFSNDPGRYSETYPILMRCLSVRDILLILSDGYYNDVHDYSCPGEKEISEKAEAVYEKYKGYPVNHSSPIQPEDLLTMKHYFKDHINNAQSFQKTDFFGKVALVAERIPSTDWLDVFAIFWNKSKCQTKLFEKLTATLAKLKYSKYVYLSPQALLHDGINANTVMSVQCLNELFESQSQYLTDAYLRTGDNFEKLSGLSKSEVCAVCEEIIIKINKELLDNVGTYDFNTMSAESRSKLGQKDVAMTIFEGNDMLDFPGARSRTKEKLETLESDLLLTNVFLRGKVAFLFNKYNEAKKINILLYCHHGEKNEVADIPLLLGDWIKNNMGDTIEKRKATLDSTGGISPLFYIGTKFNIDMEYSTENIANSENSLKQRWHDRFQKVLYKECFNVDGNLGGDKKKIFINWTAPGEKFQNSYILRDFKYSGPLASKLYDGERTPSAIMTIDKNYYELLRRTFIESDHVKQFFSHPELAWDVCSSMNNDGALYIIQNLSLIATKMRDARELKFNEACATSLKKVLEEIKDYLVSTDADEILKKNIRQANRIFRELEFTCQNNPEYFGHLLQALQYPETISFKQVHKLIPTLNATVAGDTVIKDYELIRKRCNYFEGCEKEEEKWKILINAYHFADQAECEEFLQTHNISPSKLFAGDKIKRKNSAVIANALMNGWRKGLTSIEFMNTFTDDSSIEQSTLQNLVNCILTTAEAIDIENLIVSEIKEYSDVMTISEKNEDLIADIISTTISDFVMDFGFCYLTEDQKNSARRLSEERGLPAFDWISRERKEIYEEEEMTDLFNSILDSSERFTPSYETNYNAWLEYMYIAFVAHINVPEFDREANDRLKVILEGFRN